MFYEFFKKLKDIVEASAYKEKFPDGKPGAECKCGAKMWNHKGEPEGKFLASIRKSGWEKDGKGVFVCPKCKG